MSKKIEVSNETWQKIKDIVNADDKSWQVEELEQFVGKKLFIRTVTYHLTGRVVRIVAGFAELENAAWIAESDRFMDTIKSGKLKEVEPVGQAWVNLDAITDMFPWKHDLPQEQK